LKWIAATPDKAAQNIPAEAIRPKEMLRRRALQRVFLVGDLISVRCENGGKDSDQMIATNTKSDIMATLFFFS
jgi:hypothetical protein